MTGSSPSSQTLAFNNANQITSSGYHYPTTGNWTQQDTLNAPLDPHNANRYEYAADDPINYSDLTGQGLFGEIVGLGATLAGSVALAAGSVPLGLGALTVGVVVGVDIVACDAGSGIVCNAY